MDDARFRPLYNKRIMKKQLIPYNNYGVDDDFKSAYLHEQMAREFESMEGWIYLGADITNPRYARIGMTKGDLGSRSYSSANPNYYLFCAFKCKPELHESQIKTIENIILQRFQDGYRYPNGMTKRAVFYESGQYWDCFYDIDFLEIFVALHEQLYTNYRSVFTTCGVVDDAGGDAGVIIECLFNPKVPNQNKYRQMIAQN